jgi:hypothetical protein
MPFDNKDAAQKANFVHFAYNMFQPGVLNRRLILSVDI